MKSFLNLKEWILSGSKNRKWTAAAAAASVLITIYLMLSSGSSVSASDPAETSPLYFFGVLVKLASVLLLIIGGAVMLRRWQGKSLQTRGKSQLKILETVRLSPRQAVHLVAVGDKHLLIGATDQGISMLTSVEVSSEPETQEESQPVLDFSLMLQSLALKQPAAMNQPAAMKEFQTYGNEHV